MGESARQTSIEGWPAALNSRVILTDDISSPPHEVERQTLMTDDFDTRRRSTMDRPINSNAPPGPPWRERLSTLADDIGSHETFLHAGSLAYTTALALAPFMIILLSVAALLGQDFQNQIYAQLKVLLGPEAGGVIQLVVEHSDGNTKVSGFSGLAGLLVLAASASAIFSQLRAALDKIDGYTPNAAESSLITMARDRFLSVGLVFGFVFLSITSLAVTTTIAFLFRGQREFGWQMTANSVNLVIFIGLFTAIFRFVPSGRHTWRRCLISGFWGTTFFLVGKAMIGLYLGRASVGSAYGAAGSLIVFLVWVYYTTSTLLVSYEFTRNLILVTPAEGETIESGHV
jgi:membrane protein